MYALQILTGNYRVQSGHRKILYSTKGESIIEKGIPSNCKRFFSVTGNPFSILRHAIYREERESLCYGQAGYRVESGHREILYFVKGKY